MAFIEPTPEQIQDLAAGEKDTAPIVMINLLRYREQADYSGEYPATFDVTPCSGRDAYQRYGAVATQRIASVGGRVLWLGAVGAVVVGPAEEPWDDAVLVEYPSVGAFLEMVAQPEYQAAAPHRSAALADSRLFQTRSVISLLTG